MAQRKRLTERYDLNIDEWLIMKERKHRYEMIGRVKELQRELRKTTGEIDIDLDI